MNTNVHLSDWHIIRRNYEVCSVLWKPLASISFLNVVEIHSYVRGYHTYMHLDSCCGRTGLLLLKCKATNVKDKHAVVVYKDDAMEVPCVASCSYRL